MEKYTNDELLDVLPSHIRELKSTILSPKQKAVLGQLIILDGLDKKNSEGYIFRSNLDLCNDCDIEEKTMIAAVRKLVLLGFIDTVRGSRKNKASLYRLNKKVIDDYCKTPVKDYSNDYSKQIAEMTNRIKELEITVKKLVERITVIEGKNYSTDTDIDKELDIEKDINNNIINKKSLYNNIEETVSSKELENGDSKENPTEYQLASIEILASAPIDELSQATPDMDSKEVEDTQASTDEESIPVEQQKIPTEEEQYQQWLQVLTSYLLELESVKTLKQFDSVKNKLLQVGREYLEKHEETSPTVIERMNKTIACALKEKKTKLLPDEMELSDYLAVMHN
jgi:hypothetical protein